MKNSLSLLAVFLTLSFPLPDRVVAERIDKNAVILKKVLKVEDSNGKHVANEAIFHGGLSAIPSTTITETHTPITILRELRAMDDPFTVHKGKTVIQIKLIPLVTTDDGKGMWNPAPGRWDFLDQDKAGYESVIHVQMGGDLDIAYQSTEMRVGNLSDVLHYGLTGNPHAIRLSRKRLRQSFGVHRTQTAMKPHLSYTPRHDVILVQLAFTPEGPLFIPIFDYHTPE